MSRSSGHSHASAQNSTTRVVQHTKSTNNPSQQKNTNGNHSTPYKGTPADISRYIENISQREERLIKEHHSVQDGLHKSIDNYNRIIVLQKNALNKNIESQQKKLGELQKTIHETKNQIKSEKELNEKSLTDYKAALENSLTEQVTTLNNLNLQTSAEEEKLEKLYLKKTELARQIASLKSQNGHDLTTENENEKLIQSQFTGLQNTTQNLKAEMATHVDVMKEMSAS